MYRIQHPQPLPYLTAFHQQFATSASYNTQNRNLTLITIFPHYLVTLSSLNFEQLLHFRLTSSLYIFSSVFNRTLRRGVFFQNLQPMASCRTLDLCINWQLWVRWQDNTMFVSVFVCLKTCVLVCLSLCSIYSFVTVRELKYWNKYCMF